MAADPPSSTTHRGTARDAPPRATAATRRARDRGGALISAERERGVWLERTQPGWRDPVPEVVGVDVSDRHEAAGEYLMVAAAVHAAVIDLVVEAVENLPEPPACPIVSEHGEFYQEPAARIGVNFQPEFKYVESVGERETVQAAHHAAYAARDLLL